MKRPSRIDSRAIEESLSVDSAARLLATGGQLVDVRPPADFDRDALPGALNLPVAALTWKFHCLNRYRPVILCSDNGSYCHHAARLLAGEGFSRIYHLAVN
ncbi:MAG: rhodanese-like domain-containing protein [Gammaproteobacteria bacterium]|nr:MAG: rhodanese-like domain-containing protein [Gammaproteobacteria bacterium]